MVNKEKLLKIVASKKELSPSRGGKHEKKRNNKTINYLGYVPEQQDIEFSGKKSEK